MRASAGSSAAVWFTFSPTPSTTTPSRASASTPATLRPSTSTSFGHLSCAERPSAASTACAAASPPTSESCAIRLPRGRAQEHRAEERGPGRRRPGPAEPPAPGRSGSPRPRRRPRGRPGRAGAGSTRSSRRGGEGCRSVRPRRECTPCLDGRMRAPPVVRGGTAVRWISLVVRPRPVRGRDRDDPRVEARPLAVGRAQPGRLAPHAAQLRAGEHRDRGRRARRSASRCRAPIGRGHGRERDPDRRLRRPAARDRLGRRPLAPGARRPDRAPLRRDRA